MSEEKEVSGEVIEGSASQQQAQPESKQDSHQTSNQQDSQPALDSETRNWGMACHLSSLSGFVIPFGGIIGPLIVWLVKRDEMEYVNYHGKESLNFQITILIAIMVSLLLTLIVVGVFLLFAVGIFWFVMTIIAGIKASSGERYEYPLCLRLIK